jgi:hypothetical protein
MKHLVFTKYHLALSEYISRTHNLEHDALAPRDGIGYDNNMEMKKTVNKALSICLGVAKGVSFLHEVVSLYSFYCASRI